MGHAWGPHIYGPTVVPGDAFEDGVPVVVAVCEGVSTVEPNGRVLLRAQVAVTFDVNVADFICALFANGDGSGSTLGLVECSWGEDSGGMQVLRTMLAPAFDQILEDQTFSLVVLYAGDDDATFDGGILTATVF